MRKDRFDFQSWGYHGGVAGRFCSFDIFNVWERKFEHVAIEKKQCAQSHRLCRGRDMQVGCKMSKELTNFILCHFLRVSFIVKEDEASDPTDVGVFGFAAVVFDSSNSATLIK